MQRQGEYGADAEQQQVTALNSKAKREGNKWSRAKVLHPFTSPLSTLPAASATAAVSTSAIISSSRKANVTAPRGGHATKKVTKMDLEYNAGKCSYLSN
jgi:hypothetical protein